jgi:putative transposase
MEEELRKNAINRHIQGGESPKDVYTSLNRSKKWFFKWLTRYQTGSPDWFKEQSRAPKTRPSEIDEQTTSRILLTRQKLAEAPYAQIGVSAIKWELQKQGLPFPSDRTINRVLKREGLVKKNCLCLQRSRVPLLH